MTNCEMCIECPELYHCVFPDGEVFHYSKQDLAGG